MNSNVMDVIRDRATCRNFSDKKIDESIKDSIFEAICKAPSGGDLQALSVIAVEDENSRKFLRTLSLDQSYVEKAPLNLIFCIDWSRISRLSEIDPSPTGFEDNLMNYILGSTEIGIAAHSACLAAESFGLKSVYIGNIINYLTDVKKHFELPKHVYPVLMLCIGHPKTVVESHEKYPVYVTIHKEKYAPLSDEALLYEYNKKFSNMNVPLNESIFKEYKENCDKMYPASKSNKLTDYVKSKGYIGMNQYTFGIFMHQFKNAMTTDDHIEFIKDSGFKWFVQ